jgi:glycine cleavage system H protein
VKADDAIGAVESVKSASDIYAPVSGVIVEGNSALESKPGLINSGPESEGWIAKIMVKDPAELDKLLDAAAYKEHTDASG